MISKNFCIMMGEVSTLYKAWRQEKMATLASYCADPFFCSCDFSKVDKYVITIQSRNLLFTLNMFFISNSLFKVELY